MCTNVGVILCQHRPGPALSAEARRSCLSAALLLNHALS